MCGLAPATNAARFYRLASTNPPAIGIYLGTPTPLLEPNQWGMTDVPHAEFYRGCPGRTCVPNGANSLRPRGFDHRFEK
jgi:hypothetical protein